MNLILSPREAAAGQEGFLTIQSIVTEHNQMCVAAADTHAEPPLQVAAEELENLLAAAQAAGLPIRQKAPAVIAVPASEKSAANARPLFPRGAVTVEPGNKEGQLVVSLGDVLETTRLKNCLLRERISSVHTKPYEDSVSSEAPLLISKFDTPGFADKFANALQEFRAKLGIGPLGPGQELCI